MCFTGFRLKLNKAAGANLRMKRKINDSYYSLLRESEINLPIMFQAFLNNHKNKAYWITYQVYNKTGRQLT